jgi:hypothetical protein
VARCSFVSKDRNIYREQFENARFFAKKKNPERAFLSGSVNGYGDKLWRKVL